MTNEAAVSTGPELEDEGVEGNSRLTGLAAALLLVILAAEGATLLNVGQWLSIHVFLGMVVLPLVAIKLASTTYRAVRYYVGDDRYRHRGPPPWLLRGLGPLVALSTVALLATGIALVVVRRGSYQWLGDAHRASFIAWFAVMVIHVLGHLVETGRLSSADFRPDARRVRGAKTRTSVIACCLVVGIGLGAATTGWVTTYQAHRPRHFVPAPTSPSTGS